MITTKFCTWQHVPNLCENLINIEEENYILANKIIMDFSESKICLIYHKIKFALHETFYVKHLYHISTCNVLSSPF